MVAKKKENKTTRITAAQIPIHIKVQRRITLIIIATTLRELKHINQLAQRKQ